ncbi:Protein fmp52, mitochondrial [Elasticomyces elasticus]|uniref:Protein fmp52, mitochondrial n=1 Tax=Exophiala sideris TaxID=1016849 RepID=A0ABR0IVC5_9EURO|nr:Protein fmp52, mitochondrial [Elasticomyces elasticus]KAK5021187.1 Protein fmp52, mitochondrial [Exophiala sideris]KAK5023786.1 Protein fmp52, mitochondrial [Exophiala sideris]KAK5048865.1 Protein fmp52, mitochondrial [Exophiala sideris]KAK5176345.1 Protein fmp52, mitochondrial [Eurotiomycetes sp. CCFEE 6388]
MATALILGSTGLVGSHILSTLRAGTSHFSNIDIIARRSPPAASDARVPTKEVVEPDTSKWVSSLSSLSPTPSVLFCALATTRGAAGGFDKQYKLEHDLNIELAKAAKEAGTKTYVLISSGGADPNAYFGYPKMKGEIEEDVKALGFDHTIILRPGLILGHRQESRAAESAFQFVATLFGRLHSSLRDSWAQDADAIAKAAISAAVKAEKGEVKEKVWILGQKEILRLGVKEWKAPS